MHWIREHPAEEVRARLSEPMRTSDADVDIATIRSAVGAFSADGSMPPEGPATSRRLYTLPSERNSATRRIWQARSRTTLCRPGQENEPVFGRIALVESRLLSRRQVCVGLSPLLLAGCRSGRQPLRLVSVSFQETFPLHAAVELGYLREAGIELQIDEMPRGSQVTESLVGGSADLAYHTFFDTLLRVPGGRRLRSFCAVTMLPQAVLAVTASAGAKIHRVEDLKGTVVGIAGFGSGHQRQLEAILAIHGMGISAIQLVAIGNGPPAIAAMEHGKVRAAILNTSVLNALKKRSPGIRVLVDPRSRAECRRLFGVDTIPAHALLATSTWIEQNPETARHLARAMVKTMHWIREHPPEEVRARLPERMRTADADADHGTIRSVAEALSLDGKMPPEGPATVRRLYTLPSEKQRGDDPDLAGSFTNDFVEGA